MRAGIPDLARPRSSDGRRLAYELERPYVSAHEGERVAEEMKRTIAVMRDRVRAGKAEAHCPAASEAFVGADGLAVRCGVERSLVTERDHPSSLACLCLAASSEPNGGYTSCPSWRAEWERERHGNRAPLVSEREGT